MAVPWRKFLEPESCAHDSDDLVRAVSPLHRDAIRKLLHGFEVFRLRESDDCVEILIVEVGRVPAQQRHSGGAVQSREVPAVEKVLLRFGNR